MKMLRIKGSIDLESSYTWIPISCISRIEEDEHGRLTVETSKGVKYILDIESSKALKEEIPTIELQEEEGFI